VQDACSKQQTKQKYKPNHQQTGLTRHSAMPTGGKKQTNKQKKQTQHKSHPTQGLHKPLGQAYKGRNQKKERIQP